MNPLLYGFYQLLKLIVRLSLRIFYPYRTYIQAERLRFDYPAILISNHPNTLLDPLMVAAKTKKLVFFLANAGLFKSTIGHWFFNTFYCIPIQRPQDKSGKNNVNNKDSFAKANEHLAGGGVLFIAPEGTSEMERRVRPFKTGTARIALSTEAKNDFQLGMAIVPVGLTYYQPNTCGSRVIIKVGDPVFPQQFEPAYKEDPIQTARDLTEALEKQMRGLAIDTRDAMEDRRLRLLEAICQTDYPLAGEARFQREMQLLHKMRMIRTGHFFQLLDQYGEDLQALGVKDHMVIGKGQTRFHLIDLLSFPVYIYGLINNFLPMSIPAQLTKILKLYVGYDATVKILSALITIPLFYWLQTKLVGNLFGQEFKWYYLLSLPISALLSWKISSRWKKLRRARRYRKLDPRQKADLKRLRAEIVDLIR